MTMWTEAVAMTLLSKSQPQDDEAVQSHLEQTRSRSSSLMAQHLLKRLDSRDWTHATFSQAAGLGLVVAVCLLRLKECLVHANAD